MQQVDVRSCVRPAGPKCAALWLAGTLASASLAARLRSLLPCFNSSSALVNMCCTYGEMVVPRQGAVTRRAACSLGGKRRSPGDLSWRRRARPGTAHLELHAFDSGSPGGGVEQVCGLECKKAFLPGPLLAGRADQGQQLLLRCCLLAAGSHCDERAKRRSDQRAKRSRRG